MAKRKTMNEAEELKAEFEERYPGARIEIREFTWGTATRTVTEYEVGRICICDSCGEEKFSIAIGEDFGACNDCKKKALDRGSGFRSSPDARDEVMDAFFS